MAKQRRPKATTGSPAPGPISRRPGVNAISGETRLRPGPVRPTLARPPRNSRRTLTWLPIAAALLVLVLAVGGYILYSSKSTSSTTADAGVFQSRNEGQTHVPEGTPIQYVNNPPSSGSHYPSPKPWGVYEETIAPGYWVHDLEHGGVVVLYDCPGGCPDVVQVVSDALKSFPPDKYGERKLLSTPYSGLPNGARVAVVAWQYVATFPNGLTSPDLLAFYNAHVNRSPEDVP